MNRLWQINVSQDIFLLPNSSGTTGPPKSVMLTHASVGTNMQQILHPGTCRLKPATSNYQTIQMKYDVIRWK